MVRHAFVELSSPGPTVMGIASQQMDTRRCVSLPRLSSYKKSHVLITAKDIMFTNPWFSKFFAAGQVVETERGAGVFQPAIDESIRRLQEGEWVRSLFH